jgi:hypothetical protein
MLTDLSISKSKITPIIGSVPDANQKQVYLSGENIERKRRDTGWLFESFPGNGSQV